MFKGMCRQLPSMSNKHNLDCSKKDQRLWHDIDIENNC